MVACLALNVPLNYSHQKSHSQCAQALKTYLQESYQLVPKNAAKTAESNKVKFPDKWEALVHVVVSRKGHLPVYTVKQENKNGTIRTLHRI